MYIISDINVHLFILSQGHRNWGAMAPYYFQKHVLSPPFHFLAKYIASQPKLYTQRNTYLHMRSHTTIMQKHSLGVWNHQSTATVKLFIVLY